MTLSIKTLWLTTLSFISLLTLAKQYDKYRIAVVLSVVRLGPTKLILSFDIMSDVMLSGIILNVILVNVMTLKEKLKCKKMVRLRVGIKMSIKIV